jgi:hypothetical protein
MALEPLQLQCGVPRFCSSARLDAVDYRAIQRTGDTLSGVVIFGFAELLHRLLLDHNGSMSKG